MSLTMMVAAIICKSSLVGGSADRAPAVLLTLLIANLDVTHRGRRAAIALATTLIVTGAAQGLNLVGKLYLELGFDVLPSWALGCLEIVLVLGFGVCMALCVCAGAGTATLRSGRESP